MIVSAATGALADGGTVRLSEVIGDLRVTVLTSPVPLVCGQVEISVLVQDRESGGLRPDARVKIALTLTGSERQKAFRRAEGTHAVNKLYQSVVFQVATPGEARIEVQIEANGTLAKVECLTFIGPPRPGMDAYWAWLGWPAVPILLYSALELRRQRNRR
jgi:hypothetical protein